MGSIEKIILRNTNLLDDFTAAEIVWMFTGILAFKSSGSPRSSMTNRCKVNCGGLPSGPGQNEEGKAPPGVH